MNKVISLFLLGFIGICSLAIIISPQLRNELVNHLSISNCDFPVQYHIGSIDPRFGLSSTDVVSDIQEAINIWDNAEGKNLFVNKPDGLAINFVYDTRQALNSQIDSLKTQLDEEKNNLDPKIQEFNQRSATFKQNVAKLNQEIAYWNSQGGAPPDEYKKLTDERDALQQEAQELNVLARQLNQTTQNFNAQVGALNQTVDTFNESLKLKPEEGLYVPRENKIDIYFNVNHTETVHTLAHELGHALGMDHNNNKDSIMYPYTTQTITPSADDLAALQEVCKPRLFFQILAQKAADFMYTVLNKNTKQ
jgi:hypothetical protein